MDNITGPPVTHTDYLSSRLYLIDELRDLSRKFSIIIDAPRRFGKTSTIKEFIRQEDEKEGTREFNILFLELEGEETIDDFCFKLFKELLALYHLRKHVDMVKKFFEDKWNIIASIIPKIGLPDLLEIELREHTRDMDFNKWKEKLNPMISGLNSFDKKTVIVFDEFPDMLMNFKNKGKETLGFKNATDSLTSWLRTLRQKPDRNCKYQFIYCGSINLRKTMQDIGIGKRINDLEALVIPPMNKKEAEILIMSLVDKYHIEIEHDGIQFMITKIIDGSPYFGQILIKSLRDTREKTFTADNITAIYEDMLRGGNHDLNHFHSRLEDYLSTQERECSSVILKHVCAETMPEKELFDSFLYERVDYEVFRKVVDRLIYEGYIMRDIKNVGHLRFVSPLLKDWWACKVGVK